MSVEIKLKPKRNKDKDIGSDNECNLEEMNKIYSKKCGTDNKELLNSEFKNREELEKNPKQDQFLYPTLDDPNFNIKIAEKKEFSDTKYDGSIYDVEKYAEILKTAEYELLPQQAFVRNFLSFQTPYNSLLLFHGLGSGKTCSAIGVCEEMRDYLKQMGINKRIIIVASPNVQDNFKLQLFDERKLKEIDGIWTVKGCLGNKLLKEINPTGMKGLKKEKVIQQVKNLINSSYSFQGYVQFSNEIVKKSGKENSMDSKIRNLEFEYSGRLIVIDEVHNIRISDDNENKNVAKNLMFLVSVVSNMRLLLLSATPMFNNYKEIVWLLNLMNMNDRRGIISVSDIFNKDGSWRKDEVGKELLIRKATGYVSYVRGENPYTFPFRVYPDRFAMKNTFQGDIFQYPLYQINGSRITQKGKEYPVKKLSLFLTAIGKYQQLGYTYIIDRLRSREEGYKMTRKGTKRKVAAFSALRSFGYTDLQIPIEALNIVYPYPGLDEIVKNIAPLEYIDEEEPENDDISPSSGRPEKEIIEEMDEVITSGPLLIKSSVVTHNSELESEPAVTEGIEGDITMFDKTVEPDTRELKSVLSNIDNKKKTSNTIFDIVDNEHDEDIGSVSSTLVPSTASNTLVPNTASNTLGPSTASKTLVPNTASNTLGPSTASKTLVPISESKSRITPSIKKITATSNSFKGSLVPKKKPDETSGLHIVEGQTKSHYPSEKNTINSNESDKNESVVKGGADSSSSVSGLLYFDPKDLTGTQGLKRIMDYVDSKTPSIKGQFEYKKGAKHVFDADKIGKYSSKIKNVCDYIYNKDTGNVSDGIILIYSSYIDAGVIPMALALESMGFTRYGEKSKPLFKTPPVSIVDVRTMKPPTSKKDFKPARYIMITGDPRISPNNDADVKAITNNDNIFREDDKGNILDVSGQIIKVVIISQAGSEGLDFKAIRQIHILEPWYNMNRIEQIIGRGVRNFSHKDIPFSKRNVQIFLYGTILENAQEESADLYVYRISEIKAVKIGKVTRLLKQTAVDCIINHDQTKFISKEFDKIEENRNIVQILSDHQKKDNFEIGDRDNSATCDFMECEFKCLPHIKLEDSELNADTYNETFMLINSDKIIQKIKSLMRMRYFYTKDNLISLIDTPKIYPKTQIFSALTQIITDNTEYITDKYGRTGYLVNIGDYYLFQPSELNYKNISIYERSVPINYKHNMINFQIKSNIAKPVIDKAKINSEEIVQAKRELFTEGKKVLDEMLANYNLTLQTTKVQRGNDNWYEHCGVIIRKMAQEENVILAESEQERLEILEDFLIEHIVDSLMMNEKIDLLNYIYSDDNLVSTIKDKKMQRFLGKVIKYLKTKEIVSRGKIGLIIFNGPSRIENVNVFILNDNIWEPALPEDINDLLPGIGKKYHLGDVKKNLNKYVGFIGFENNKKYMVYKVKDTENERSTGFRCNQSGKEKIMKILNDIELDEKYISKVTKEGAFELCVRQEFTLRGLEYQEKDNPKNKRTIYFLDTETAIINEFEKKEKAKK
jgi:superfamily II DNA or RNA helicase